MARTRVPALAQPDHRGVLRGLAYSVWHAPGASSGVVVIHGAGSQKEHHHDFARAALGSGLSALCFDQRGHGSSAGALGADALDDLAMMAAELRAQMSAAGASQPRVALRGSSLGGYLALCAASLAQADAVVAICPPDEALLRRLLDSGRLRAPADVPALRDLFAAHPLRDAVRAVDLPVMLMHAEGDDTVPVECSRELEPCLVHPASRLIEVPGGHHGSVQHDPELQATSLRFLARAMRGGGARAR